jgi:hypothetical protein
VERKEGAIALREACVSGAWGGGLCVSHARLILSIFSFFLFYFHFFFFFFFFFFFIFARPLFHGPRETSPPSALISVATDMTLVNFLSLDPTHARPRPLSSFHPPPPTRPTTVLLSLEGSSERGLVYLRLLARGKKYVNFRYMYKLPRSMEFV